MSDLITIHTRITLKPFGKINFGILILVSKVTSFEIPQGEL